MSCAHRVFETVALDETGTSNHDKVLFFATRDYFFTAAPGSKSLLALPDPASARIGASRQAAAHSPACYASVYGKKSRPLKVNLATHPKYTEYIYAGASSIAMCRAMRVASRVPGYVGTST